MTITTHPAPGDVLDCGDVLVKPDSIGTGYALDLEGRSMCYRHADEAERALLAALKLGEAFVAYVGMSGDLETWSGGKLARLVRASSSRTGWHGSEVVAYRFRSDDGTEFYGRNAGEGCVITVRRAKG